MEAREIGKRHVKSRGTLSVRASISFPPDIYEMMERLARKKKVSLAWVVRDAVERYVTDQDECLDRR